MSDPVANYRAEFERIRAGLPGTGALDSARETAMTRFVERGFPGARDERWKYTKLDALARHDFSPSGAASAAPAWADGIATLPAGDAYTFTFVNGHLVAADSEAASGIRLQALSALDADARRVAEQVVNLDDGALPSFTALNTALFADGVLLELGAGAILDKPLVLRFINDANEPLSQHPRVIIAAGTSASATVFEVHLGNSDSASASFCNAVTQVELGERARIEHVKLHWEAPKTQHIGATRATLAAGAHYQNVALALKGQLARNDIEIFLDGEQAEVHLHGLLLGDGRRHIDSHTLVEHRSPNARSEEIYKAVLNGRSRGVFDGAVRVHKGADGTDAAQRSNNLLLSDNAEIDTKPQLEIYADDVKCAHGATVGQLDEHALFYLQARGISLTEARSMLTAGFAQEIVDLVGNEAVRDVVRGMVDERLAATTR